MSTVDPLREILDHLCDCAQTELGEDWSKIKYLEDIEKNNERTQNKVFGIRPLEANEVEGSTKFVTLDQTFELVLVRSKLTKTLGDSDIRDVSYDSRRLGLCFYKKIARTHAGGLALVVNNLTISEPEFLENDKVVVQRISFNVKYRCQI